MKEFSSISRRKFVKGGAAAAGLMAFPSILRSQEGKGSPNSRLQVAQVGTFGKGYSDMAEAAEVSEIVALCDVDRAHLVGPLVNRKGEKLSDTPPAKLHPDAKTFADFRKMLDEMGDKVDAVIVSTPDHSHFPVAMEAIKRGKHVMVQKPLTNTLWEVRQLHEAAKKAGVITQMGNQGHTMEGTRVAREWLEQGAIGELKHVELWTNRPIWPQGPRLKLLPTEAPENLDWQLWLAALPEQAYRMILDPADTGSVDYPHPFSWRSFWEYGSGALGDMACHVMDSSFWALDLDAPHHVELVGVADVGKEQAPPFTSLRYHFAAKGDRPGVVVRWQDGGIRPATPEGWDRDEEPGNQGICFVGTEGIIFDGGAYCASPRLMPDKRRKSFLPKWEKNLERSTNPGKPTQEWLHYIEMGQQPPSSFDYSAKLTEMVLLGNLAIRSRHDIEWDSESLEVTNHEDANKFVKRPAYRKGWNYGEA